MKKILAFILAATALLFCACGNDDASTSSEESTESAETSKPLPPSISMIESEDMGRFDSADFAYSAEPKPEESVFVKESGVEYGTAADGYVSLSIHLTFPGGAPMAGVTIQLSNGAALEKYTTDAEGKIYVEKADLGVTKSMSVIGTDGNGMFFGTLTVVLSDLLDCSVGSENIVYYVDPFMSKYIITCELSDGEITPVAIQYE